MNILVVETDVPILTVVPDPQVDKHNEPPPPPIPDAIHGNEAVGRKTTYSRPLPQIQGDS